MQNAQPPPVKPDEPTGLVVDPVRKRVEGKTQSGIRVITCEDFVNARPWICCRDPYVVGREKDGTPLVAQCDKKIGHSGVHRGRFDGNTYMWRMRNTKEIADEMARRQAAVDQINAANDAAPAPDEDDPNKE